MNKNFQQIWSDFHKELEKFVYNRVKDNDVTNDILQEVFIKIYQNLNKLQDDTKINSWIYQITRNAIIDYFRKQQSFTDIKEIDIKEPDLEKNENDELQKCIVPFIEQLPQKYKEAIIETELKGVSQKELSNILNISYSATKSRVQRAREKLKILFSDCCIIQNDNYGNVVEYKEKKTCNSCFK